MLNQKVTCLVIIVCMWLFKLAPVMYIYAHMPSQREAHPVYELL